MCARCMLARTVPLATWHTSYLTSLGRGENRQQKKAKNKQTKIQITNNNNFEVKKIFRTGACAARKCTNLVNREFIMIINYDIDPLFIVWMMIAERW